MIRDDQLDTLCCDDNSRNQKHRVITVAMDMERLTDDSAAAAAAAAPAAGVSATATNTISTSAAAAGTAQYDSMYPESEDTYVHGIDKSSYSNEELRQRFPGGYTHAHAPGYFPFGHGVVKREWDFDGTHGVARRNRGKISNNTFPLYKPHLRDLNQLYPEY